MPPRLRKLHPPSERVPWRFVALPLLPLVCVVLGGATVRWNQGVTFVLLGALLLAAPPHASAGRGVDAVIAGLLLLSVAAFVPAAWLPAPWWRSAMADDLGLPLSPTYSPQAWVTAENLVIFLAGIAWFYQMWTLPWSAAQKVHAGRVFAGGVALLAGVFSLLAALRVEVPFWPTERHFGPFPNRNQTANFLAVGTLPILACARSHWRAGQTKTALGWLAGWLAAAWAIFVCFSRAGVAILFAGTAAYLGFEALRSHRRNRPVGKGNGTAAGLRRLALAATVGLALLSAFLLLGGETLERFRPSSDLVATVASEFRVRIQADAARLTQTSPWIGIGLGNFAGVFPQYRVRSALPLLSVHPESDFLWTASELGWPALALMLAGWALIVRRLWPPASGPDRSLRLAAIIGLGAFFLHGLVDVSSHRPGTVFAAIFLAGLALPPAASHPAARWAAPLFRALGAGLIVVGLAWVLSLAGAIPPLPGRVGAERLKAESYRLINHRDYAGAERAASRAVGWAPLDSTLYFARAVAALGADRETEAVLADFRRARFLEPFLAQGPYDEARFWLGANQPELAVNALLEACRREPLRAEGFIGEICRLTPPGVTGQFHARLADLTRGNPGWNLAFLDQTVPPESVRLVAARVADDPELQGLDDAQKTRFFRTWAQRGDPAALVARMAARPDWQNLGWRWWADACGRLEKFEDACAIAARFASKPPLPSAAGRSAQEILHDLRRRPDDPFLILQLYRARRSPEDSAAALEAVRRITARRDCARHFYYVDAALSAESGDWIRSWRAWEEYL